MKLQYAVFFILFINQIPSLWKKNGAQTKPNSKSLLTAQKLAREQPFLSLVCVIYGFIHNKWWAKLDDNNSAFQAEMASLREAMHWLSQESLAKCSVHTDIQSPSKVFSLSQILPGKS
ncbi:hypothetical protein AVEN_132106-1 [Araneus ventricosus]|uniref:RNase H type-1 domain-containing protein n=1 Tax=Araneus ventricosus TaxID=182803 RepID=A0A4Y2KSX7_ARAVE|nr:hypothetical protein AVEN_132106-1 [Araneus ventricosus]